MNKFDGINNLLIKAPGIEAFCNNVIRANKYKNNNYSLFPFDQNYQNESDDDDDDDDDDNNLSKQINDLCLLTQENDKLLNECFKLSQELEIKQELESEYNNNNNNNNDNLIFELKKIMIELNLNLIENKIIKFIKENDIDWNNFDKQSQRRSFVELLSLQCKIKPLGKCIKLWVKMHKIHVNKTRFVNYSDNNNNKNNQRSLMFISEQCTNNAINNGIMIEYFTTSKQLFHYLRWTIKMQQIDGFYKIFNIFNKNIIIFNTELHDNKNGEYLYIIGSDNDKITAKSPKWKMEKFLTCQEIFNLYGIKNKYLPIGSRSNGKSFKNLVKQNYQRKIIIDGYLKKINNFKKIKIINLLCYIYYDPFFCKKYKYSSINNIGIESFCKLPQIKTQQKKELHKISPLSLQLSSIKFYKYICDGINSLNISHEFISIVSFDKHKISYFIDLLLPIKLPRNNWIGIIFRNYIPISICIDCNDIKTKCKLFNANYNILQYKYMTNKITRLSITQIPLQRNKNNNKNKKIKLIPLQQKR